MVPGLAEFSEKNEFGAIVSEWREYILVHKKSEHELYAPKN